MRWPANTGSNQLPASSSFSSASVLVAHQALAVGRGRQVEIVDDHDVAVLRQVNVELDPVGAQLGGEQKGRQRIGRRLVAGAPVGKVQWPVEIE